MKTAKSFYLSAAIFAAVLFSVIVFAVALAGRFDARLDLTEAGLHTVSPETKQVLSQLTDRVTIQYWVSEKVPIGFNSVRRDTIDYLKEFERLADGKIQVEVRDPKTWIDEQIREAEKKEDAGEKEEASFNPFQPFDPSKLPLKDRKKYEFTEQYGVPEVRGQSLDQDKVEVIFFYSGLRLTYRDREPEVVPVHQTLDGLEYELASRLVKLTIQEKPKLAFFHGRPSDTFEVEQPGMMPGMPATPRKMSPYDPLLEAELVTDLFDVQKIELTEASPIPEDADLLIVAQPDALNERQLYEIDRYIAQGGSAMFLTSRYSGAIEAEALPVAQLSPGVDRLFQRWGVQMGAELISSEECGTITRERPSPLGRIPMRVGFPLLPVAGVQEIDSNSPLTLGLQRIVFGFATELTHDEAKVSEAGLTLTVLAKSTEDTWGTPFSPQVTREMVEPTSETPRRSRDLAYYLEGTFPPTFQPGDPLPEFPKAPDAKPDDETTNAEEGKNNEGAEGSETSTVAVVPPLTGKPGRVVIAASCDMAKISQLRENQVSGQFLLNCFETLSLGEDLVNIRAKGQRERLLEKSEPWQRNVVKWGNAVGIPLLVILFGVLRYLVRRTVAYAYEERFIKQHDTKGVA
ncbi:MAG: GldG family protein [Planctomycetes bacterium]|nr:GldG family protein [Planctomycetota bacterium]